jgi:radical SAM/Cys-rich protein
MKNQNDPGHIGAAAERTALESGTGDFDFASTLKQGNLVLAPISVKTMQLNITTQCNQSCTHCHVDASPQRTEKMTSQMLDRCLQILAEHDEIEILDITGGAPELHPYFLELVQQGRTLKKRVMVRHNLTILFDVPASLHGKESGLPEFFADNGVEIVASLPYYQEYFTDKQRGAGAFRKSIEALKLFNRAGYGRKESGLILNLVYNPAGAFLPATQASLETDFKSELLRHHGVVFNHLYAITNMPINRFKARLEASGTCHDYMLKLKTAFNPMAALNVMCRTQVSVGYDGKLYDCDFNQMLGLAVSGKNASTIFDFDIDSFLKRDIIFGPHCYGCTAGAGSSCGGTTA